MKRKMSVVLSATLAMNLIAVSALSISKAEVVEENISGTNLEINQKIDGNFVKKEESTPSIIKPELPTIGSLAIEKLSNVKGKIEGDLKTTINLPNFISSSQTAIKGKLAKGVGVALYKLTDEEVKSGKFTPTDANLISDSKFNVKSEDGSFLLPFMDADMKAGSHIAVCVPYSTIDDKGQHINNTFMIDTIYIGVKIFTVKTGDNVDVTKAISGLPNDATIEVLSLPDTSTIGNKEAKIRINYDNMTSDLSIPIIVNNLGAVEDPSKNPYRISGSDRFETNLDSIKRSFENGKTDNVIIASGNSFADPLAAGPLAMKMKSPIIFTDKNGLSQNALNLIKDLGAKNAIIVGGKSSVSPIIETQLSNLNVRRIAGEDRYDTSKLLVKEFGDTAHLIITDGRKFADALSATPLAKKLVSPILLVEKTTDVTASIKTYKDVYLVGGTSSVSTMVEYNIKLKKDPSFVYRVYGRDRAETSSQVAKLLGYSENILANGNSFADALSSINLLNTGVKNLLLVGKDSVSKEIVTLMKGKKNYIIGGYNTVSKNILGY